ncbi:MAG: hypothetical protein FJ288_14625 [Planctomycetes bacterium]|nr:hypothetical protein [Planctomycetota bacterium]
MTSLRTAVLSLALALAAAACAAAAGIGAVPQAPAAAPQLKDLDTFLPDVASDDIQRRANALKAVEMLAMNAARPGAEAERAAAARAFAARLGAATPQAARVWLLRQLQLMGRAEVIPALVPLLDDKDALVRESARRALQWNPAPEAADALRAALAKAADPAWRVALVGALGSRKDAAAAPAVARLLADKDESVVAAALAALGNIGGPEAARSLSAARAAVPPALKAAAADACLKCADLLLKEGKKDEAAAIYQQMYAPAEPATTRLAALRGLVMARGEKAIPLIAEVLAGKDAAMKTIALSFVQEIPGPDATAAMTALLPKLGPADQAAIITQLGSRGDAAARAAVLAAARNPDAAVRAAAFGALATLGGPADVPMLAQAAAGAGPEADAARAALTQMRGQEATQAMAAAAARGDPKQRAELIKALAGRRAAEAAPAVTAAVSDADPAVRLEAVKALETIGDEKSLPALVAALAKAAGPEEPQALEKTILAVCGRAANKAACLQPVLAALAPAQMPAKGTLIKALGRIGGTQALGPVRAAVGDADPAVRESAVRALADWPDATVAPDLLAIARTDAKQTNQVLAIRGYLRLAGLPDRPAPEKIKMCQEALAVVKRADEKKLVLGVLGDAATPEAFNMVAAMLDEKPVQEEAALAATKIGKALGRPPAGAAEAMEKILAFTKNKNARKDAEDILKRAKR